MTRKQFLYLYYYSRGAGFSRAAARLVSSDFSERVTADGGTLEAEYCFETALLALGIRTLPDFTELIFQRWTEDGATIEAETCFNNSFALLNS